MSRRVYLPTSSAYLQTLLEGGALEVVGEAAYAVTDALRRAHPQAQDDEELEFLAYAVAVGRAAAPKVVLAADIDAVQPSGSGAEVRLGGSLTRSAVAALHVEHPVHSADGELLWYDASELGAVVALLASGRD